MRTNLIARGPLVAIVLWFGVSLLSQSPQSRPQDKIDRAVLAEARSGQTLSVMIVLADQPHAAILDRHERSRLSTADRGVVETRRSAFGEIERIIVPQQDALDRALRATGGRVKQRYRAINMVAAEIPGDALQALDSNPLIASVFPVRNDEPVLSASVPALGAPAFWQSGYTGAGQAVAVLDTGVRSDHPAFSGVTFENRIFLSSATEDPCFGDRTDSPLDQHGHGTAISGVIVGRGSAGHTDKLGVARGTTTLYNLKIGYVVRESCGSSTGAKANQADVTAALDWLVQNTPVKVVNYSYAGTSSQEDDGFARLLDRLADTYGLLIVVPAGNGGSADLSVGVPGVAHNVITVGGWSIRGAMNPISSRGPTLAGRYKPDLAAPGTSIQTLAHDWHMPGNALYRYVSGTSIAAPHIAGAALLLRSAGVTDMLAVKAILLNTSDDQGWANDRGWGYANLNTARGQLFFVTDQVAARGNPGFFRFYKVRDVSNLRATLTWNRRFNAASSGLNDADLHAYALGSGALLGESIEGFQNVEQISVTAGSDVVLKVRMDSATLAGGSQPQRYALARSGGELTAVSGPSLSMQCSTPSSVNPGAAFQIACRVSNNGDLPGFQIAGTLILPAGFSGARVLSFGTVAAGATSPPVNVSVTASTAQALHGFSGSLSATAYAEEFGGTVAPFQIQVQQSCTYSLQPASLSFGAASETGSISITAPAGCAWSAAKNAAWVTITAGATGSGSGVVQYAVAANSSTVARSGQITVAGQAHSIFQSGLTVTASTSARSDFDGNGVPDLLWQHDDTRSAGTWYLSGPSATTLLSVQMQAPNHYPGWRLITVADLDGDGIPDLIWQNDQTRQVGVWHMSGPQGATLRSISWPASGSYPGWTLVAVADMNRDGVLDLLWQNDQTRAVGVWFMGGSQRTTQLSVGWLAPNTYPGWTLVAAADMNRDGVPDLVWQHEQTRQVGVWYMAGAEASTLLFVDWPAPASYPGWRVVGVADMNRDGVPDLIWQNDTTREVGTWLLSGARATVLSGIVFQAPESYPGWRAVGPK